jgi:alpha-1,6-mannosyltransferase
LGGYARLALLCGVGLALELVYLGLWPIGYLLTQTPDFTNEYVRQYPWVWERTAALLATAEQLFGLGAGELAPLVDAFLLTFGVAIGLYVVALWLTASGLPRVPGAAVVVGAAAAFHATLFAMPGLFTTDLFSYITYGRIAGYYNVNPFIHVPAQFPGDRTMQWIHPVWHFAASIYGPVWVDVSALVARYTADWTEVDQVMLYKLIVNIGHLGGVAALAFVVSRLRPGAVLQSLVMYAWNPLVVFEFGGNGHNDAVMIALMLAALGLYVVREYAMAPVILAISFLVKMSSVLAVPYLVMSAAISTRSFGQFVGVGFVAVGATIVTIVGFYAPWWVGIDTLGPILLWTQGPMFNNHVPDVILQHVVSNGLLGFGGQDAQLQLEELRVAMKSYAKQAFAVYCLVELLLVRSYLGGAAAAARVMLVFLLAVNTWVLPWYFTWSLALCCVAGWRSATSLTVIGFCVSAPLVMYYKHFWHPYMSGSTYFLFALPLVIPIGALAWWIARGDVGTAPRSDGMHP